MRACVCWTLLCLMGGGCATTTREFGAPPGAVDVVAHRGASAYAPENTLAAFQKAAEMGADWFELDCHLSKDGEVVIIHDDTLHRTTDGTGGVRELTWESLQRLDAGSWFDPSFAGERLPSLDQSLELAQRAGIGVYIEIKSIDDDAGLLEQLLQHATLPADSYGEMRARMMGSIEVHGSDHLELTRKCIEAVRRLKMADQVVIQSFSPVICCIALQEAPEIRTEFLGGRSIEEPEKWEMYLQLSRALGPAGCNLRHDLVDRGTVDLFHGEGRTVAVWTVDKPERMSELAEAGVDGIITNKPDVALDVLRGLGRHP
jgi:glycerophosphoryl diester phosphodiesterase